ncbi:MAG: glycosyltransferase family 4 protein [Planctomycetota bacterium]
MNPKHLAVICDKLDAREPVGAQAILLAHRLLDRGHRVTVIARTVSDAYIDPRVEQRTADVGSRFTLISQQRYVRWLRRVLHDPPYDCTVSLFSTLPAEIMAPMRGTFRGYRQVTRGFQAGILGRPKHLLSGLKPGVLANAYFEKQAFDHPGLRVLIALSPLIEQQLQSYATQPCRSIKTARCELPSQPLAGGAAAQQRGKLARAWGLTGEEAWVALPFTNPQLHGVEPMLRAMKPLLEQGVNAVLLLLGQARYTHLAWIDSLGLRDRIRFVGKTAYRLEFLKASDLIVSPASFDPSGMGVLDGLATQTPIITTDACGLAEAVQKRGGTVIGSPADPAELLKEIREQLTSGNQAANLPDPAGLADALGRSLSDVIEDLVASKSPV